MNVLEIKYPQGNIEYVLTQTGAAYEVTVDSSYCFGEYNSVAGTPCVGSFLRAVADRVEPYEYEKS
jgi:hypothetical protein